MRNLKSLLLITTCGLVFALTAAFSGMATSPTYALSERTFPETGKTVRGVFLEYWNQHGSLAQQGLPISEELQEKGADGVTRTVQYFERAVFELHPENSAPFNVLLSRLGSTQYAQKYPTGAPNQIVSTDNPRKFAETGHSIGGVFRTYWEANGGLAQQGLPISDELQETSPADGKPMTVQYFERAVFELHPENKPPYNVLLSRLGASAYNSKYSGGARNIVLVHGAWADGSSWSSVIMRLQQAGYTVTAVQLSLNTLDDDVARTRQVLAEQNGPTILVAHSYGGAVITQLGTDAPNVVGLVYVAAFAPDQGESMKSLISSGPQPASAAAIRPDKKGYLWLDPAGFVKYFAPDVDPIQAWVMASVQKPIAASLFLGEQPFGVPAWKGLPSWYLVTEDDQMIVPDAQRFFAARMKAQISSVASSHVPMVSHPDVVSDLIVKAAQSVSTETK